MRKRIVKFLLVMLSVSFCFLSVTARTSTLLPARFSANTYTSTNYFVGQADLMLPLTGDAGHNFYIDPALAYGSESQAYADLGVGYRWIKNSSAILGGYLFGGYSRIDNNARLWVVNPGIEALGSRWDAHLNGYLVRGDRNTAVSSFLTFDEFSGHSELFNLFDVTQHAGDGGDVKIGYQLFPRVPLKAYVGSYFFSPAETNNVLGGAIGLEYWLDQNIKVFANYTYDNLRRSVGAFGIGVELGGTHVHRSDPSVEERITDPVERYLAELGRGSAIPNQQKTQLMGQIVPANRDDDAFFSQTGTPNNGGMGLTLANCTFENPCGPTDLTDQGTTTLETLLPNTRMFFGGGTYSALDVPGGTNPVTIRTGQSIALTPGTPPSTFEGGFILEGDNSLNDIILEPTASTATGAGISALGDNVAINGSQIGSMATPFTVGLLLLGDTQADLNNSRVFASSIGVNASGSASLTTNASMINVTAGTNPAFGINSTSSAPVNLSNGSSIIVQGGDSSVGIRSAGDGDIDLANTSVTLTGGDSSLGITSSGNGDIDLANSTVTMTGGNTSFGISSSGNGDIDLASTNVTLTGGDTSVGIVAAGNGAMTLTGSQVTLTGGTNSVGLGSAGSGAVTVSGSQINLNGGANSTGYRVEGSGPVNINGNSMITVNAAGQTDVAGLATTAGSSSDLILTNTTVNVTSGANSFGLDSAGSGAVTISGSQVNLNGGANSAGYLVAGSGAININGNSMITVNAAGQTFISGLSTTAGSTSNVTLTNATVNVTGGANSFGLVSEGSGAVNVNGGSTITVDAPGQTAARGLTTAAGSSSDLTLTNATVDVIGGANSLGLASLGSGAVTISGSQINLNGGASSTGYQVEGSGAVNVNGGSTITVDAPGQTTIAGLRTFAGSLSDLTLNNATVNVTGGANSVGLASAGSGAVTVSGSQINLLTGGTNSAGYLVAGSGAVNINGNSMITVNAAGQTFISGLSTTAGSSSGLSLTNATVNVTSGANSFGLVSSGSGAVTVSGSQIILNGGASSTGYQVEGSGAVNINGNSMITVNAPGQTDVAGLVAGAGSTSNITLNGSNINVTAGDNSEGIVAVGSGTIDLANANLINISGTGVLFGIDAANSSAIIGSDVNLIVSTDNTDEATGLFTNGTATITLDGVDIDVSGDPSSLIRDASGGPITLTGTNVCMLNGSAVTC